MKSIDPPDFDSKTLDFRFFDDTSGIRERDR